MKKIIFLNLFLICYVNVSMAQNRSNAFKYVGCGCDGKVDIRIYNGLYGTYGGQLIEEANEISKGAVTVANKNNTDGDSVIDNMDNSVSATTNGRDEVDLMKLEIVKTGTFTSFCKILELKIDGNIKIWKTSRKVEEANLTFDLLSMDNITTGLRHSKQVVV